MTGMSASALKVIYSLRPAKQIERRMLIDALLILSDAGMRLRSYQYTGMGSLYFVDFILFHKLLGISDLLSVEFDVNLERRVRFNRPFDKVRVAMSSIGDVIPTLSPNKQHLLWLDYDFRLNNVVVEDVQSAAYRLTPGSILLVTVDVKPPPGNGPIDWMEYYARQASDFFELGWGPDKFAQSELPRTNSIIVRNLIRRGLRPGTRFFPLFNFLYADGHPMITVGGMIGGNAEEELLARCTFDDASYICTAWDEGSYQIQVPRITHKERMHIDKDMPCPDGWQPREFALDDEDLRVYRELYRFYPNYVEMLV